MTKTQGEGVGADTPETLHSLLGTLNLLSDDAAGYCSGGVCHFPAPSVEKSE